MKEQKNQLEMFAGISGEIKRVARLASDIEMTAINGMIMANKSAGATSGFGVVALEIQVLSVSFLHITQELTRLVYRMAYLVGQDLNQSRRMRIFSDTARSHARAKQFIAHAYDNGYQKNCADATAIKQAAHAVVRLLQRAESQCIVGVSLGCVGKLEAVYDANMAESLRQVSDEVQERMNELLEILKSLTTELQVWL